jgi:hypothetical protein
MFLINLLDAGMAYDTPTLFNRGIDRSHRSFLSAVQGAQLGTFRPRPLRQLFCMSTRGTFRGTPLFNILEAHFSQL